MITICPNCNKQVRLGAKFCGYCGHDLVPAVDIPLPARTAVSQEQRSLILKIGLTLSVSLILCIATSIVIWIKTSGSMSLPPMPTGMAGGTSGQTNPKPTTQDIPDRTVVAPLPTIVIVPSSPPTTEVPPPTQLVMPDPIGFIYTYYNLINSRDYAAAWYCLSTNFIDGLGNKQGRPYDFAADYVTYWDTVSRMDVLEASTEQVDSQSASLLLKLRWNMLRGEAPVYNHRFYLVKNPSSNSWLIDVTETWK